MARRSIAVMLAAAAMAVNLVMAGPAMASDTIVQNWTQVAPRQNRSAPLDSGAQVWPAGVNVIQGRIDCTPFSGAAAPRFDADTKVIDWTLSWSFDGGVTWLSVGGAEQGSPTGTWGKAGNPYPSQELDFSYQAQLPTHYRAQADPQGTINFGVSVRTLNRVP